MRLGGGNVGEGGTDGGGGADGVGGRLGAAGGGKAAPGGSDGARAGEPAGHVVAVAEKTPPLDVSKTGGLVVVSRVPTTVALNPRWRVPVPVHVEHPRLGSPSARASTTAASWPASSRTQARWYVAEPLEDGVNT